VPFRHITSKAVCALALLALGSLAACGGGSGASSATTAPGSSSATTGASESGTLKPTALGDGQCYAGGTTGGGVYAQVAESDTTCEVAVTVAATAGNAKGTAFSIDSFSCTAVAAGPSSPWDSAWRGTYYTYSCKDGDEQVAFNWGSDYAGVSAGQTPTATTSPVVAGTLQPATVGDAQCGAGDTSDEGTYAQVAVSGATCPQATMVAYAAGSARGGAYSVDGFSCTANPEGAGSTWASAWGGTYYAYSCKNGAAQVAFNWGTDYTYS
jgi:hypothetical protein